MKELEDLIAVSRKYGSDPRFVIVGGGNTSYKDKDYIWVKASGHSLATIEEEGFAKLSRRLLSQMARRRYDSDAAVREEQVKSDLYVANLTKDRRPSVETSLHNCMEFKYVVHLHPTVINGLMCAAAAKEKCAELYPEALFVEYTDPGYTLFKKVFNRIRSYRASFGCEPHVIFLQNHGVFVAADTVKEIDNIYDEMTRNFYATVPALPEGDAPICSCVSETVPAIRTILSRSGRGLKTIRVVNDALISHFIDNFDLVKTPFTPDGIVYCKSEYLCLEGGENLVGEAGKKIEAYVKRRGHTPKVILVKGIGLLAVGENAADAANVAAVFHDALELAWYSKAFGGPHPMNRRQIAFIDGWEVENYRRRVSLSASRGRAEGKTVIVTGAAQGFGEGIARELYKEGANIVVADLNEAVGNATAESFNAMGGHNRAIFVKTNVADMDSLNALMRSTVINFGALDLFVSNAGVLRAGGLEAMTPENFEFVTNINYKAYFFCAKVASHIMKIETALDPEYFADIVQVNSKSGLRGSKANFAYAGGKFGGIGLTQSFALELAPYRVKVNSICPGNFYDGPLWSNPENGLFVQYLAAGKVPGAKTVADVKTFYLNQVPMHKGCNPQDVCKAILYAVDQTGETGQAIPVTGGQVMLS